MSAASRPAKAGATGRAGERAPRRGTPHAPGDVRRAQILEGALRCFGERGYARATMDDVAAACDLSKGSLYRFFASKEELLLALFDVFDQRIAAAFEADRGASGDGDALTLLDRTGAMILETLGAQRGEGGLLQAWLEFLSFRDLRDRFAATYGASRRSLAAALRAGLERGELHPATEPDAVAAAFVAVVEGLLLQALVDPAFDPRRAWDGAWAPFRRGIAAPPGR